MRIPIMKDECLCEQSGECCLTRLKLQNENSLEITNKHLNKMIWGVVGDRTLHFSGLALGKEGQEICESLSEFRRGQIVEVEAEDGRYGLFEGVCEIIEVKISYPEDFDKAPLIYRFRGVLKQVF